MSTSSFSDRQCLVAVRSRAPWLVPVLLILVLGCAPESPQESSPGSARTALTTLGDSPQGEPRRIVVVSFDGLRADVVGGLGARPTMTPHLDRFLAEADIVGRAVTASSLPAASMASLLTGLPVWRHGAWDEVEPRLADQVAPVTESLRDSGFETTALTSSAWLSRSSGLLRGFAQVREVHTVRGVVRALSSPGERSLTLVDLGEPAAPFERSAATGEALEILRSRAGSGLTQGDLPSRLTVRDLEQAETSSPQQRDELAKRAWLLYGGEVLQADRRFRALVDAIEDSEWSEWTSIVVISTRAQGLGEAVPDVRIRPDSQLDVSAMAMLSRSLLEVPIGVRVAPRLDSAAQRPRSRAPVYLSIGSVAATILELAGLERPPGLLPSAFEAGARSTFEGGLTEMYSANGLASYSWLTPEAQIVASERFATADSPTPRRLRAGGRSSRDRQRAVALRLLEMSVSELRVEYWNVPGGASIPDQTRASLTGALEAALLASGRRVTARVDSD